jgi:glycosyltransferase involved in cell wall biosynthesis
VQGSYSKGHLNRGSKLANYIYAYPIVNYFHELIAMKKVLLIAYHFPPLGGGGVFRTLKFTKYLPEFGYQPHVLTVKNPMYREKDLTLVKEIPKEAEIQRTFSFEHRILRAPRLLNLNLKWFYLPDPNIGWLPFGVSTGSRHVKKEKISVIYATSPIWTSLLIGLLLKKKTKKPLVVDFRDPWTDNPFNSCPTKFHERLEKNMEKLVLAKADYVTVATDSIKTNLIRKYPFIKSKIETITNGFDPEDFKNLKINKRTDKFTITYVGSIYGLLTAKPFLTALKELTEEKKQFKENVEAIFVGNCGKETPRLVGELGLEQNVRFVGYVPHRKGLEFMVNSQALLLLITLEGSKGEGILTGKLFEYLAARKPIIALAPEDGLAANVIKSLNAGTVVSPLEIQRIKKAIASYYDQWEAGKLYAVTDVSSDITPYNRKVLTGKLAQIFDKVSPNST